MKLLVFLFSIIVIFSSCFNWEEQVEKEIDAHKVILQSIWEDWWKDSFSVIWEVFSESETMMSAKFSWDVQMVNVKNWDSVRTWDVLIKLKSDPISTSYEKTLLNNLLSLRTLIFDW